MQERKAAAKIEVRENQSRKTRQPVNRRSVDAIARRIAALPVLDHRTEDEILGYDQFGVPK